MIVVTHAMHYTNMFAEGAIVKINNVLVVLLIAALPLPAFSGKTLDAIKKRGYVRCGVHNGLPGFSVPNSKGKWRGLDVDVCHAFAAAVLGDKEKIRVVGLSAQQRFTALQSNEVDVLTRNTTRTLSRDTALGFNFAPVNYYDGQGFLVKKSLGVKKATELNSAAICVAQGTTNERNLSDYFRKHNMKFKPVVMESHAELFKAFMAGRCDVYTTDAAGLAAQRSRVKNPDSLVILPDIISKEPLSPVVRHGDDEWFDITTWSVYAMIAAEEMGITSKNVDKMKKKSKDPDTLRLLGVIVGNGKSLGLDESWAYNIIKQVGNYGESFERHVGKNTPLRLARGLNALWTQSDKGLMYAPPIK